MAPLRHLAHRFFGSLWPVGPSREDSAWAEALLLPGEVGLWRLMSGADRRHAIGVTRRVAEMLGQGSEPVGRPVMAAALLHDVGKIDARLGTYGRVVATVAGRLAGPSAPKDWSRTRGFTRRVGLYLRHAPLGADRLQMVGSDPFTVTWAAEHHLPPEEWTVSPLEVAWALKRADDD